MANRLGTSPSSAPNSAPNENYFLKHKYLFGGLFVFSLVGFVGALVYCCVRRRKVFSTSNCRFKKKKEKEIDDLDAEKMMLRRFQLEELEKATNNFSRDCLIGSGAFGNVYVGTVESEGTLAIKKARADSFTSTAEFRNEVKLLSKVKHRNLVGLVGYCEETGSEGAQILVYEYIPNGSLLDYIVGRGGKSLTWKQRVNIAIGAAKGIAHLHEGIKPSIIHRDIKPSNILIDKGFEAKVSDFGLVKLGPTGDHSHVSSQVKGTPGYLDPAYCTSFHLSPFSDVYSFGVILLQLIAARPAVDTTRSGSNYHIIEWARPSIERGRVEDIIDTNLLLDQCNMDVMLKMGQLGLRCVVKVPKQRPTMTLVWQELDAALQSSDASVNSRVSRRFTGMGCRVGDNGAREYTRDCDFSQSSVSIEGVGLQRFHVEMDDDGLSFRSASLRCLESDTMIIDVDNKIDNKNLRGISEDTSAGFDDDFSIPRD